LKALATVGLALGFVTLVGRVPFVPQQADRPVVDNRRLAVIGSNRSIAGLGTGGMEPAILPPMSTQPIPVTVNIDNAFGLFNAQFAASESSPGFATEEHRVPGQCSGAGRRHVEKICPACQVIAGKGGGSLPSMLMWTEVLDGEDVMRAVSTDCLSFATDGVPIVGTLRLGLEAVDLTNGNPDVVNDIVPLLPGATRIAAIEVGQWLAIFDHVARPSTALPDMAAALAVRGWQETSGADASVLPEFEGERVFKKSTDSYCVISLSKQGETYQLLTVVSAIARG
jgi:hypothetical protein